METTDHARPVLPPRRLALLHAIRSLPRDRCLPCWVDPELWFSTDPFDKLEAMKDCRVCPVRSECLAAAFEAGETSGIWGGQEFTAHTPERLAS
ncbi:WhiB family transcriptional regulator [Streptomyces sp. NPDC005395]|uniref:WhiB family transcriptional regulator n=1 Tax=Streptomyces sp. NPDC005395 TaxID=3157042 RepID=UPI0033A7DF48